jgi:hypothetical protein
MAMTMCALGRMVLVVQDAKTPTDEEWARFMALCEQRTTHELRVLVETPYGAAPDAKQRKLFADALLKEDLRIAVMTDSLVARGIITAFAWLGISLRPFSVGHYRAAADYLGLSDGDLTQALQELPRLRQECAQGASRASTA